MNEEQAAILAATVEVLTTAVELMLAERIMSTDQDQWDTRLAMLHDRLVDVRLPTRALSGSVAATFSDLTVRKAEVAKRLSAAVRARIAQAQLPEGAGEA